MRLLATLPLLLALASSASAQQADAAPVDSRTPDPVTPSAELARSLARFDGEADPGRALKRAFCSTVHHLVARDLEKLLPHFHPALRFHTGGGDFERMTPEKLRAQFAEAMRMEGGGGPRQTVDDVLDLTSVRAYSRARAREADALKEGWTNDPRRIARLMEDEDWLVMGKLLEPAGEEVFYVLRKDGAVWKVVLAE